MSAKKAKKRAKRVKDLPAKTIAGGHARTVRGGSRKVIGTTKWPNIVLKSG